MLTYKRAPLRPNQGVAISNITNAFPYKVFTNYIGYLT